MTNISQIIDPFERYIAFIVERNAIYHRKKAGDPWPWTQNEILQRYRFTNVYREIDKVSIHYQKTIRNRYGEDSIVLPGTVLYRWFNRIETCDALFNQLDLNGNRSPFEWYMEDNNLSILQDTIERSPPPHVTGAYIINGKPGYTKGDGVLLYFHDWCQKPWKSQWEKWAASPPSLQRVYEWLREDGTGLGSFMTAQLVADLKYLPSMMNASDWWTWAAPGPGSQRGLNLVLGRPIKQSWNTAEWQEEIQKLRVRENAMLEPLGLGPFHAQDTQNHCCEYSKFCKVMLDQGRPRQVYHAS
jgi:hypothetical protein